MTQPQTQQLNPTSAKASAGRPQIFTVYSDEIEGRIDPSFYRPEIFVLAKQMKKSHYKLEDLITNLSGGATPKIADDFYMDEGGIPFLRVQNITDNGIDLEDVKFIKSEVHNSMLKRSQLKSGDIIFTITGRIGSASLVPDNFEGNINQHSVRFHLKSEIDGIKILPQYIVIYFNSDIGRMLSLRGVTGGTRPALDYEALKNLQLPLPPLPIQTKIVSIMAKAYQEKKEKEEAAKKLLNSIDDYVLGELGIPASAYAMAGKKMVFEVMSNKVENGRIDAEYWQPFLEAVDRAINQSKYKTQKLKKFITKIHYGASTSNAYADEGIPFLRILNLKPNHLKLSDIVYLPENFRKDLGNAFVATGDLLISRSGTVGVVSVMPKEADGFAFGSFMIKFCLDDKINKEFVSIWLNNKLNKLLTEREKIGAIQGNITISTIENFDIPIPPPSIQNKIAEKVELRYFQAQMLQNQAAKPSRRSSKKSQRKSGGDDLGLSF